MSRPLKMFMRGKNVRILQEMLKRLGYPMDDEPGIFAASTRDAVKNFQSQKGVQVTGIVDNELLSLMRHGHNISDIEATPKPKPATKPVPADITVDQGQLDALIRLLISKGVIGEDELHTEMSRILPRKATRLTPG